MQGVGDWEHIARRSTPTQSSVSDSGSVFRPSPSQSSRRGLRSGAVCILCRVPNTPQWLAVSGLPEGPSTARRSRTVSV